MPVEMVTPEQLELLLTEHSAMNEPPASVTDSTLLRRLSSIDRVLLTNLMVGQVYAPGQVVFRERDIGDAMYLIWGGRVAVVKGDLESPTIVAYRGPGDAVGEMAFWR